SHPLPLPFPTRRSSDLYQQKRFARTQAIEPVITPDGRDGTLKIRQDARLLHIRLHNEAAEQPLAQQRSYYVHCIRGPLSLSAGRSEEHTSELQSRENLV